MNHQINDIIDGPTQNHGNNLQCHTETHNTNIFHDNNYPTSNSCENNNIVWKTGNVDIKNEELSTVSVFNQNNKSSNFKDNYSVNIGNPLSNQANVSTKEGIHEENILVNRIMRVDKNINKYKSKYSENNVNSNRVITTDGNRKVDKHDLSKEQQLPSSHFEAHESMTQMKKHNVIALKLCDKYLVFIKEMNEDLCSLLEYLHRSGCVDQECALSSLTSERTLILVKQEERKYKEGQISKFEYFPK